MPRSLTVLLKPQVLQHPDYAKYNPVNLSLNPRPGPSDIGSVFTRNNDRSKYLCYVSIPDIVPFIAAQAEYIEGIMWDILKEPAEEGAWRISFVDDIHPLALLHCVDLDNLTVCNVLGAAVTRTAKTG
ncbi:hypothetical protein [Hymenobacter daeguensis]